MSIVYLDDYRNRPTNSVYPNYVFPDEKVTDLYLYDWRKCPRLPEDLLRQRDAFIRNI